MSFYGNLNGISIGDLLKNLEGNRATGTFTLEGSQGTTSVYFQEGRIAMMAGEGRPSLPETLVACGLITVKQFESSRNKRRGSRKSLGEVMVGMKMLGEEKLRQAAELALFEGLCDLIASADGEFSFVEGTPEPRAFDPEVRRLNLAFGVEPLLLEAARRSDHWQMIRKVVPSDGVHFVAVDGAECPADIENAELAGRVLQLLDGTRDVREVAALFPLHGFLVYVALARFVREHLVRAAEGDDLLKTADLLARNRPDRARRVIAQGLRTEPRHFGLLHLEAKLAEGQEDYPAAANALRLMAHLELEAANKEEGRRLLEHACELQPGDGALHERLLDLSLEEQKIDAAIREGMKLVEIYRAPGLHGKARDILIRLVEARPDAIELRRELARSQVESGDPKGAVKELTRCARRLISEQSYSDSRALFEAILDFEPGNAEAEKCIAQIDADIFARRRARLRKAIRRLGLVTAGALVGLLLYYETAARIDYVEATSTISRELLIENHRYQDAITKLEEVARKHPYSVTRYFELRRRLEDMRSKLPPR